LADCEVLIDEDVGYIQVLSDKKIKMKKLPDINEVIIFVPGASSSMGKIRRKDGWTLVMIRRYLEKPNHDVECLWLFRTVKK
jgi:hypothetical protein